MPNTEEEVTITVRISADLKKGVETLASARDMTLAGVVRRALEEFISPPHRVTELPGLSQAFQNFLDSKELERRKGRALLLVIDDSGSRAMYPGHIDPKTTSGGIVGIWVTSRLGPGFPPPPARPPTHRTRGGDTGEFPWPILRKNVVGWYSPEEDFFKSDFIAVLHRLGWHPVTYNPR